MRIALISDIHANIVSLQALLQKIEALHPDVILSLGDQVNLGPKPKETLEMLKSRGVVCLHGNHERYVLSVMEGDPSYAGANYVSLRYTASRITEDAIHFPPSLQIGTTIFCHSMPGEDNFPIHDASRAWPRLPDMIYPGVDHIVCGHGHNPSHYHLPGLQIDSIGSSGCMDAGMPGMATFTMMELTEHGSLMEPHFVSYDPDEVIRAFLESGMADYCPIMAHVSCLQMTMNQAYLVPFVKLAESFLKPGENCISQHAWQMADSHYEWPDGTDTREYWASARERLG